MKKIIVTYMNRKTMKNYTLVSVDEANETAVVADCETAEQKTYKLSTLKKNYKRTETEVEVEEPKQVKALNHHQQMALKNIEGAYELVIGEHENAIYDGDAEEMPPVEDLFEEAFGEAMYSCHEISGGMRFDGGPAPACMRFAGKKFVREQLAKMFEKDGYEVPAELIKVPEKKHTHSNIVDGERINLRIDEGERLVQVRAFTGMLIGTFKIEKETKNLIIVKAAKGRLKFDKKTGLQVNASKKKFANRIDI